MFRCCRGRGSAERTNDAGPIAAEEDMTDQTAGDPHPTRRVIALPLTSARDGYEHLVDGDAMMAGKAGRFTTLCGRAVWAAALASPPGPQCRACTAVRDADAMVALQHRGVDQRGVRMLAGWLRRREVSSKSGGTSGGK